LLSIAVFSENWSTSAYGFFQLAEDWLCLTYFNSNEHTKY
jgi:hypothetical protein